MDRVTLVEILTTRVPIKATDLLVIGETVTFSMPLEWKPNNVSSVQEVRPTGFGKAQPIPGRWQYTIRKG